MVSFAGSIFNFMPISVEAPLGACVGREEKLHGQYLECCKHGEAQNRQGGGAGVHFCEAQVKGQH